MQKLPAFPAGAVMPYSTPVKPLDWAPIERKSNAWGHMRTISLAYVAYNSWWVGRNLVSRHFTGKDAHAVGGVPSTLQGYLAVGAAYPIMRIAAVHGLQWNKWNIAPAQPWVWDHWTWHKSARPARWAAGLVKLAGCFTLGVIKVAVDKVEIDRRIAHKDLLKVERDAAQKAKAEAAAAAASAKAAAEAKAASEKAARKAAKRAAKEAEKAAAKKAGAAKPKAPDA